MQNKKITVADVVNQNPQAATIFKKHKIDFCCNGKKTLEEACLKAGISINRLMDEVNQLTRQPGTNMRIHSWSVDLICDYIVDNHHNYLRTVIPEIKALAHKVASVHGENHPELVTIYQHFDQLSTELYNHLEKEEKELFPALKMKKNDLDLNAEIEGEHEQAGALMAAISRLSDEYNPPGDACTSYRVLFQLLEEFEDDLHQHVHIENNILLPKAEAIAQ